jgi:YXWGXW repeat-containing protein
MRPSLIQAGTALQHALVGIVLAISLAGCVAYARAPGPGPGYYGVVVDVAPPPPRVIEVPPPRAGFVWAPGYWSWNGRAHVWIEGHWVAERPGYRWVPDRWEEYNGRWRYVRGHWER